MKIYFWIFVAIVTNVYSQQTESYKPELYMNTINVNSENTITFKFTNLSMFYCWENAGNPIWLHCDNCQDPAVEIISGSTGMSSELYGWNYCYDNPTASDWDNVGYGIYKVTEDFSGAYFYIDFRDNDYVLEYPGWSPDMRLVYNGSQSKFKISYKNDSNFSDITNGQIIKIWKKIIKRYHIQLIFHTFGRTVLQG